MSFVSIARNIISTQGKGRLFTLQVGSTVLYFGKCKKTGTRLELFTPVRWFKYSRGQ